MNKAKTICHFTLAVIISSNNSNKIVKIRVRIVCRRFQKHCNNEFAKKVHDLHRNVKRSVISKNKKENSKSEKPSSIFYCAERFTQEERAVLNCKK
jgi:hypothetical protein